MQSAKKIFTFITLSLATFITNGQSLQLRAEKIRQQYHIPALGYAVVTSHAVKAIHLSGIKKTGTTRKAQLTDRFRIGSNTKAITGVVAALLVHQGKLSWTTRFFDLFPELKQQSHTAYHEMNLLQMLSMRSPLPGYTYTNTSPAKEQFTGDKREQRLQFFSWMLQQSPVIKPDMNLTNLGYVGAGLMLERASGKSYEELVADLGAKLHIGFGFDNPNNTDSLQTWGHDQHLKPEPPGENYKLNWLCSAGNINISLPDYTLFIQWILKGLEGKATEMTKEEFQYLLFGEPTFSIGWFSRVDEKGNTIAYNLGNPGAFLTEVRIDAAHNKALILFANSQTAETEKGFEELRTAIGKQY